MKSYLHGEETLFRNRDTFEIRYTPEIFNFRDAQLKDIAFSVSPGLSGNCPLNLVIRGLPGTGKTTAVRRIFSQIEEAGGHIVPVYVNCQTERSRFAVFAKIYGKLHGHQPPPTGPPVRQVIYDIGKTLHEKKLVLIVCLDDANYLIPGKLLNDLIYILLRLYEEYPDARVGVILPMSDMDVNLRSALDSCVISVLQPGEVFFPPYNREEIGAILLERIRTGLRPGVIPPGVYETIIGCTMQSGDIRVGLDLVKRSVMMAEQAGLDTVTSNHVLQSFEFSRNVPLAATIVALEPDERKLLGYIAGVSLDTGSCLTTGSVFKSVHPYLPICYTAYHAKLKKLEDMRLIDTSYIKGRGRRREISLRYDAEKVAKECGQRERMKEKITAD
jgi:archaeal cell division control protein 6